MSAIHMPTAMPTACLYCLFISALSGMSFRSPLGMLGMLGTSFGFGMLGMPLVLGMSFGFGRLGIPLALGIPLKPSTLRLLSAGSSVATGDGCTLLRASELTTPSLEAKSDPKK